MSKKKIIALIPARGGSKTLPRKNVLPLNGKPLISYSIQTALESKLIDEVPSIINLANFGFSSSSSSESLLNNGKIIRAYSH